MRVLMSIGGPTVFETDAAADEILVGTVNGVAWLWLASRGEPWRETHRAVAGKHEALSKGGHHLGLTNSPPSSGEPANDGVLVETAAP